MTDEELSISDATLIARLRWKAGAYAKEAADRIEQLVATNEALVKERDEAINQLDSARHSVDVLEKRVAHFMSRAERLEAALRKIANMPDYRLPKPQDIASASLKGADHE